MKSIITLAEAARELTSATDEQEVWLAVLEAAADELRAVKSWTEGRETVPGGFSYIRPCPEWRITTAAFNQWRAANAPPPSQANQGEAAPNKPATGGSARTRHDDIQIEIDDVRAGLEQRGEPVTPAKVMAMLKARAGRPDSCISETAPDGVIWIRGSSGKPAKLTMEALRQRIGRPRKGR